MEKSFRRDFASLNDIFEFLNAFLVQKRAGEAVRYALKLAVEELFTNMVKYNTGGRDMITIRMVVVDGVLTIDLIDDDVDPFDPAKAVESGVHEAIGDRRIGGLGLRLVRSAVDKISYEYKDRRMTVTVCKALEP